MRDAPGTVPNTFSPSPDRPDFPSSLHNPSHPDPTRSQDPPHSRQPASKQGNSLPVTVWRHPARPPPVSGHWQLEGKVWSPSPKSPHLCGSRKRPDPVHRPLLSACAGKCPHRALSSSSLVAQVLQGRGARRKPLDCLLRSLLPLLPNPLLFCTVKKHQILLLKTNKS